MNGIKINQGKGVSNAFSPFFPRLMLGKTKISKQWDRLTKNEATTHEYVKLVLEALSKLLKSDKLQLKSH